MTELNLKRLGGSDAGPVLNNSPRHALDVWLRITKDVEVEGDSFYRDLGKWAEPRIVAEIEELYRVKVQKPETKEVGDRFRFSPDGVIVEWGDLLECKYRNPFMRGEYGEAGTDEVPEHELLQVQFYLEMLDGPKTAHLAAAFGGPRPVLFRIDRDKDIGRRLVDQMGEWYEKHVVRGEMPPLDGAKQSLLNKLWAKDTGAIVPADAEAELDMRLLLRLKETTKRAEEVKDALETRLKARLKDGSTLQGDKLLVTWKRNKDSRKTDWEAALTELKNSFALALVSSNSNVIDLDGMLREAVENNTKTTPGARPMLGPKEKK